MEPIINPIWIYFIDMASALKITLFVFLTIFLFFGIVTTICEVTGDLDSDYDSDKNIIKTGRKCLAVGVMLLIIFIFTPTSKTVEKMLIAQNVTYDRVGAVTDTIEQVYNDILEIVDGNDEAKE